MNIKEKEEKTNATDQQRYTTVDTQQCRGPLVSRFRCFLRTRGLVVCEFIWMQFAVRLSVGSHSIGGKQAEQLTCRYVRSYVPMLCTVRRERYGTEQVPFTR